MLAFVRADTTNWLIMVMSAFSWVVHKFLQWDICPLKICSRAGSFPVTICVGILTLHLQQGHWKSTELAAPYFKTLSVSHIKIV